jgi:hypothetical protein
VLAIENNSSAMYLTLEMEKKHIKETIHSIPLYTDTKERLTTANEGLNNITYTCARLGRKRGLKIFSWVDLEAFSVV